MKNTLLLLFVFATTAVPAQVNFVKTTDLNALLKQARQEKKLIFIDAYTDWCGWCKVLDEKVFATKNIGDTMSKYFIATRLEMEKDSIGILLTRKYGTASYPTALVLNGDGALVYLIEGYYEIGRYAKELAMAADPSKQIRERGYSNSFQVNYPKLYTEALPFGDVKKKTPDSVTVNTYVAAQKDLSEERNWLVLKKFYYRLSDEQYKRVLAEGPVFRKKYGDNEFEHLAENMIGMRISLCTKTKQLPCVEAQLDILERYIKDGSRKRTYYIENYYSKNKMWEELVRQINGQLGDKEYSANYSHLNDQAWNIYESCDNKVVLESAAAWMADVVKAEPVYMYLDTYAALLFKTNRYAEARQYAQQAITAGRKSGEEVSATEELLEKINKASK